jgi:CBS domain-containing protein
MLHSKPFNILSPANWIAKNIPVEPDFLRGRLLMPTLTAADLIRDTKPIYATPDRAVLDAAKIMAEHNIGSVPVVEDDTLVGIFTERDLVRIVARGVPLDTRLKDVMTRDLIVAKPSDPLPLIAQKMLQHGIRHIPVVDEQGRLLGVISIRRVLRYLIAEHEHP